MLDEGIKKIYDESQIAETVRQIALAINEDYKDKEIVLVCCLTGAFVFMADLMRLLKVDATCDFIKVSSYEDRMTPEEPVLELDVIREIRGKHLVVVEDIVDTGQTLQFIQKHLESKKPASVELCALLYKESVRATLPKDQIRYLGLTVPDVFVVGYGIDYAQKYRTLPYIGSVEPS
jgi:hypoxanthine phosphoribosyltransferase